MILYVNGDNHSAASCAINKHSFASDDFAKVALGKKPHPDNLAVSYGMQLSKMLRLALVCDAESGSSNERIMRTTREFLSNRNKDDYTVVVIGWTDWMRTEFWDPEVREFVQANLAFPNSVPDHLEKEFRKHIVAADIKNRASEWHGKIYELHQELLDQKIAHLFFNSQDNFQSVPMDQRKNWKNCFVNPYKPGSSYVEMLEAKKFVHDEWYHYRSDGHLYWAGYLFTWLTENNLFV